VEESDHVYRFIQLRIDPENRTGVQKVFEERSRCSGVDAPEISRHFAQGNNAILFEKWNNVESLRAACVGESDENLYRRFGPDEEFSLSKPCSQNSCESDSPAQMGFTFIEARPRHFGAVKNKVSAVAEKASKQDENFFYVTMASLSKPERIVVVEQWKDRSAVNQHLWSPSVLRLGILAPILSNMWQTIIQGGFSELRMDPQGASNASRLFC